MMVHLTLAALVVAAGLHCATVPSTAQPQDRIGFVRLALTDSTVEVVDVQAVPGRLKPLRGGPAPQPYVFDVLSSGGEVVWQGAFPDPLTERQEYVDAAGDLQVRVVRHERAEVTVRIPAAAGPQTVRLFRAASGPGGTGKAEAGRVLVGSVEVRF